MASRTLILGGGFGGIAAAIEIRRTAGSEHDVVLVDRRPRFSMGLRKVWELVGHATIADGSRPRAALERHGIRVVEEEVTALDPSSRTAIVGGVTLEADRIVVALGAESRPDLVPGLAEHGHDVWDVSGIAGAAEALAGISGGRIVVVIAGAPYPCPPAPYECAMLVDEHLRATGRRDAVELSVSTVQPMLMPNAGEEGSAWIGEHLRARGIDVEVGRKVERVEDGRVVLADGELEFDLLIAVPPHRAPPVVGSTVLTSDAGWVTVDPRTLATRLAGIWAVGDVTQIPLANGLPLPKAGVIAEAEGARVGAAIAAELAGASPPPPFDGEGYCFVEMGTDTAALVENSFYATPEPRVALSEPSADNARRKREFETERLARWFGA